jgi:hypothetical protein
LVKDLRAASSSHNLWTAPVSPYHVIHRYFTFCCDCAVAVADFPVWAVTVQAALDSGTAYFVSGCIDCLKVKCDVPLPKTQKLGAVTVQVCSPGGRNVGNPIKASMYSPDVSGNFEVALLNFVGETMFHTIEDDVMTMTTAGVVFVTEGKDVTKEMLQNVVNSVELEFESEVVGIVAFVDSVKFTKVKRISVTRFVVGEDRQKVFFPIRTFVGLEEDVMSLVGKSA